MVVHVSSARQERWQHIKETNPVLRYFFSLNQSYQESENPVLAFLRSVTSTVASWFDENETARVLRMMKALDPDFSMESFERELREYIVPEVVDAYLSADREALKSWCSEAVRNQPRKKLKAAVNLHFFFYSRLIMYSGQQWSSISDRGSRPTQKYLIFGKWT